MQRPAARKQATDDAPAASIKELSVVVPTYNETENIRPLCERLFAAMKDANLTAELLYVDDESSGSDETAKIVEELSKSYPVRIHCRKKSEGKGLSSAVLLGFEKAKYEVMLCMDADLQHEPESVPEVAAPVLRGEAEFSVGSRHVAGGGLGFEWSLLRQIISRGATMLAWPLAASTDPMSGFFCTKKEVLKRGKDRLNPIGFKIALEIAARCRCHPTKDVGITFRERAAGESKMSTSQIKMYLVQLASLYWDRFGVLLVVLFVLLIIIFMALARQFVKMLL